MVELQSFSSSSQFFAAISDQLQETQYSPPLLDRHRSFHVIGDTLPDTSTVMEENQFCLDDHYGTALTVVPVEVVRRFHELVTVWDSDTRYSSSLGKIWTHRAYHQIIELGYQAVPLILEDLEARGVLWFQALYAITGEDPVRDGEYGLEAVRAWLRWGESRGYVGRRD